MVTTGIAGASATPTTAVAEASERRAIESRVRI
jgi:hypothetical protein